MSGCFTIVAGMLANGMKIGERIKEVFDSLPKSCTISWFANRLHCDRRNIYRIFSKDNIDIQLLGRICRILQHDFFADLSAQMTINATEADTSCDLKGYT